MPRTVWALGLVSLLMDVSSEMVHALLPVFITTTLGASVAFVGLIEGAGESTAAIVKVFSGYLSDRIGKRKPLVLAGYGLGALSKPLFALAPGPWMVFTARVSDRIGKGVRGAPRDALIADATSPDIRGRAFGLRQAMDTVGAFVGPLVAIALMSVFAGDMRAVFWFAALPGLLAVLCAFAGVEEKRPQALAGAMRAPIQLRDIRRLDRRFVGLLAIGVAFTLARFSEGFLVLKVVDAGLSPGLAPIVYVAMNIVYAIGAYPAGALADRMSAVRLLAAGLVALLAADAVLAATHSIWGGLIGVGLWGVHLALTQGLMSKLVADIAPAEMRGSAFGIFSLATGLAMLAASVIAGAVWTIYGASATFIVGGVFALAAAAMLATVLRPRAKNAERE